jgi:hypothetical protein
VNIWRDIPSARRQIRADHRTALIVATRRIEWDREDAEADEMKFVTATTEEN